MWAPRSPPVVDAGIRAWLNSPCAASRATTRRDGRRVRRRSRRLAEAQPLAAEIAGAQTSASWRAVEALDERYRRVVLAFEELRRG